MVSAHTHQEVMGTVKVIDSTWIALMVTGGKVVAVSITKTSMVMRGKDMVGADQVQPGMDVVVVLAEDDQDSGKQQTRRGP